MPKRIFILLLLALLWPLGSPAQDGDGFKVIVHESVPENSMAKKQLSKVFLKKIKRWEDGSSAEALDLLDDSPIREAFTRAVHRKSISAIKSFWQRMIFSGRDNAPEEMDSEEAMLARVASTPGAVGYVSSSAQLPEGVKVLEVTDK